MSGSRAAFVNGILLSKERKWAIQLSNLLFLAENNNSMVCRTSTHELSKLLVLHMHCIVKRIWKRNFFFFYFSMSNIKFSTIIHSVINISRKEIEKRLPNLLHPGFCSSMTGLNREKRCKLAAVFAQKLRAVWREGRVSSFTRKFLQFIPRIYLFCRDLSIYSNAYGNGNHRARHAAAGFHAKTRYNFTRLGRVLFLHGPGTAGWNIFSVHHFTIVECADFGKII